MRFGKDGHTCAPVGPNSAFGVAQAPAGKSNPNICTIARHGVRNVALATTATCGGRGLEGDPQHLIDWKGQRLVLP